MNMPVVADCSRFVKIKMGDNCFEVVPSPQTALLKDCC